MMRRRSLLSAGLMVTGALAGAALLWTAISRERGGEPPLAERAREWAVPDVETLGMAAPVVEAVEDAQQAVRSTPASHAAWYDLGAILQAHALYEAAWDALERAAELRPDDPRPPYLMAILSPSLGLDIESTLALFELVRVLDPRYPPLFVRLGNALADGGRLEESRAAHTRAVELDPSYPMAHRQLGLVSLDLGDLPTALLHLEFAAELVETDHSTWVGLSRAYRQKGWHEKAETAGALAASSIEIMSYRDSVYEDVLARNVGPLRQLDLADRYARGGDHRAAVEALHLALRGRGESTDIHHRLEQSYRALGEIELAVLHAERAEALSAVR